MQNISGILPPDDVTLNVAAGKLQIKDDGVDAVKLKDDAAVDANRAVTTNHIRDNAVTTAKVNNLAVTEGKLADGAVAQPKLKTSTGEVSHTTATATNFTLPGGSYGFYPQIKTDTGSTDAWSATMIGNGGVDSVGSSVAYVTNVTLRSVAAKTIYCQQRYVTASGIDKWIFLMIDKITKDIVSAWQAKDHPSYGNGNDPLKLPHPFLGNDLSIYDIVVLPKSSAMDLVDLAAAAGKSLLTYINEDFKLDADGGEKIYTPMHTGLFNPDKSPILLPSKPSGCLVMEIKQLTTTEKSARAQKHADDYNAYLKKVQDKISAKSAGKAKLKNMGLSDEEISALTGEEIFSKKK